MNDAPSAPTVVLVHGAFADAGSFAEVTGILIGAGISVLAPANPLRGLTDDSAYIAGVFAQVPGRVLAVGHSYAGAVITTPRAWPRTSQGSYSSPLSLQTRVRP